MWELAYDNVILWSYFITYDPEGCLLAESGNSLLKVQLKHASEETLYNNRVPFSRMQYIP